MFVCDSITAILLFAQFFHSALALPFSSSRADTLFTALILVP
jgi:hypothetical protein